MKRRRFCALLGTVGVGGTAGCTRLPTSGRDAQFPPAARDAESDMALDSSPAERVDVGSRFGVLRPETNGPHDLRVWNDGPARKITVSVHRNTFPAHEAFEQAFDLAADAYVSLTLHRPAAYAIVVAAAEASATVGVDRSNFDCNDSATTVAVRSDGTFEASTQTTTMGCGPF
ncbi:hypothetical protein [Haloprofundus salilacus]|uniref:hypothetical protein n=1 Tax=Haloprofundus salilacus TaxID=2876190 RepID=UPI001CD02BD5|nr:hypothetical protein [Haloprofundus salilacus]